MKISVVIPAYNASAYLAETLNSVLTQTLPVYEILVIDDGSTDDTAAIAESFPAPVKTFRRPNSRQAASRNFGVEQATGDWIAFVDSDDLWAPNKLARQAEELARNPAADLCYTARVEFTQQGDVRTFGAVLPVPPASDIRASLYRNTTFMPSSVLMRRSTFLEAGGFDTKFKVVEDWDLWLRLLHSGTTFAACPEPLLIYRVHPGSVSHNAPQALAEQKEIYRNRVYPNLPRATRWFTLQKSQSGQEAVASYVLRRTGDASHLPVMARSILRNPIGDVHRYKVLLHMVYTRLRDPQGGKH